MKAFVFIQQKPLKIKTYTSLTALYEANKSIIPVSKSKLDKDDLEAFPYVDTRIIIAQTETQTSGDVRRSQLQYKLNECKEAGSKFADSQKELQAALDSAKEQNDVYKKLISDLNKEVDELNN